MLWIFLVLGIAVTLIVLVIGPEIISKNLSIVHFFAKGSDSGFSFREIKILWQAAREARVAKPEMLYTSLDELDRAIFILKNATDFKNHKNEPQRIELLSKLFEYRKKVEFDKPRYKKGLRTTADIALNQLLKIRVPGQQIYQSIVKENTQDYLLVTFPSGPALPPHFSWRGIGLNVYFWRENDAGYFFQSSFVEGYKHPKGEMMRLRHNDMLLRSQKRKSIRAESDFPSQLYVLKTLRFANEAPEIKPGLQCRVVDISEDGSAIRVRGRGKKGLPVKIQFRINETTIAAIGIVKSFDYNQDKDQSILHVEFLPPSEEIRMTILTYVYDMDRTRKKVKDGLSDSAISKHSALIAELIEDDLDDESKAKSDEIIEELESIQDDGDSIPQEEDETLPELPDTFDELLDDHISDF